MTFSSHAHVEYMSVCIKIRFQIFDSSHSNLFANNIHSQEEYIGDEYGEMVL